MEHTCQLSKCLENFNKVFNPDDYETNKLIDRKNNLEMQASLKFQSGKGCKPYVLVHIFNVYENGRDVIFHYGVHDDDDLIYINEYFTISKGLAHADDYKAQDERIAARKEELGL